MISGQPWARPDSFLAWNVLACAWWLFSVLVHFLQCFLRYFLWQFERNEVLGPITLFENLHFLSTCLYCLNPAWMEAMSQGSCPNLILPRSVPASHPNWSPPKLKIMQSIITILDHTRIVSLLYHVQVCITIDCGGLCWFSSTKTWDHHAYA